MDAESLAFVLVKDISTRRLSHLPPLDFYSARFLFAFHSSAQRHSSALKQGHRRH